MIPAGALPGVMLVVVSPVVGLLILYWTIRLAVRHGIEDVRHRRVIQSAEAAGWGPDPPVSSGA
ncbi:MAG: hypothetical protein ABSA03_02795 [Streptosporangiaceae bacterium]